jgi:hypothetical protein
MIFEASPSIVICDSKHKNRHDAMTAWWQNLLKLLKKITKTPTCSISYSGFSAKVLRLPERKKFKKNLLGTRF